MKPGSNDANVEVGARSLALRVVTRPRDTNVNGTIFGGVILGYIDEAAFIEARRLGAHRWVTAAMERVEFTAPVLLGDVVNCYTTLVRAGASSATIAVDVQAERYAPTDVSGRSPVVPVTSATLVMVAVDRSGKAIPFRSPPTIEGATS